MTTDSVRRIIAAMLAIAGAIIVWQSTPWGMQSFSLVLRQMGGTLSGPQVTVALEGPVAALRTMGAVLLGIGLWRVLEPSRNA
jgi:hypothetical protein